MLITKTHHDLPSALDPNGRPIRIFVISPSVPGYPNAKFPGVVCFSEIYQVTGPVERFAGQIASQGYVVGKSQVSFYFTISSLTSTQLACPSTYHEFEGPEPIPYDVEGGHRFSLIDPYEILSKIKKELVAYDEARFGSLWDATLSVNLLCSLKNCNGRIAATGMCLGGHLAFRAAFDPRVRSSVCFFATDIHTATLGKGRDDSLDRMRKGDLTGKGELVMIFGKQDTHVPRAGRDLIRKVLEDADVPVSFLEVQAQHAFIRDESSKGRWDAALTRSLFTFMMEVFERTIGRDLGEKIDERGEIEHVC
ncbi:putative carboxymethylenebutenolidase [Grifola frondosa]|uniref:Putative carboxymethylenebutenolidase n=1 Tax=Grifola frondosa TaxID=5627 RepID=A0A1C7MR44_GRIFR|nr:putative carboxymethylenebutenolidase [Grifola frondosa]